MRALAEFCRGGGYLAIKTLQDAGEEPAAEDMPPELGWEAPLWRLFSLLSRQWHTGHHVLSRLDLSVFIPVINANGWDLDLAVALLSEIEDVYLTWQSNEITKT